MKKYSFFKMICCLVLSAFTVFAENTESVLQNTPTVVERGMQYRVWQTISSSIDSAGRINYSTNSFTELCSGICYEEDELENLYGMVEMHLYDTEGNELEASTWQQGRWRAGT